MTNYFDKAKTAAELKAIYKELVKKYHPDVYGEKGNDILKDIHNQLEKAVKKVDTHYTAYSCDYENLDINETPETKALKKELLERALKYAFPEGALFALYWQNGLRPGNHRNPLTKHNFSGWNIWTLEISMLKNDYESCEWSTFPQYREDKKSVRKGEHGTYITLAICSKKKKDEDEETDEIKDKVYYKGYTVFNKEQIRELNTPVIEFKKAIPVLNKVSGQKVLNTWSNKYEVMA